MFRRTSIKWGAVLAILLSLALAACRGGRATTPPPAVLDDGPPRAGEGERISVWMHPDPAAAREVILQQAADFNNLQSQYQAVVEILPDGSYVEQVRAAADAGELPCLLDLEASQLYLFAWNGYIRPLDDYTEDEFGDDFLPTAIEQGVFAGRQYGLAASESGLAIWGNRDYLRRAGLSIPGSVDEAWGLDEFEDALARLKALPEVDFPLDMKFNYGPGDWYTYAFSPLLRSFGGDLIDRSDYQNATGVLDGPASVNAVQRLHRWIANGWVNPNQTTDDDFYGPRTAALSWVGHWMYRTHKEALGDDLVLIPMPNLGFGAATSAGSWSWVISTTCPHPEGAWAFLEFILEPEQIVYMTDVNQAVPARLSALDLRPELFGPGGELEVYVQQLDGGVAFLRPATPAYPVISREFAAAVDAIARGGDVQQALSEAARTIDQDIAANGGYRSRP